MDKKSRHRQEAPASARGDLFAVPETPLKHCSKDHVSLKAEKSAAKGPEGTLSAGPNDPQPSAVHRLDSHRQKLLLQNATACRPIEAFSSTSQTASPPQSDAAGRPTLIMGALATLF